jgi:hypothetical protein
MNDPHRLGFNLPLALISAGVISITVLANAATDHSVQLTATGKFAPALAPGDDGNDDVGDVDDPADPDVGSGADATDPIRDEDATAGDIAVSLAGDGTPRGRTARPSRGTAVRAGGLGAVGAGSPASRPGRPSPAAAPARPPRGSAASAAAEPGRNDVVEVVDGARNRVRIPVGNVDRALSDEARVSAGATRGGASALRAQSTLSATAERLAAEQAARGSVGGTRPSVGSLRDDAGRSASSLRPASGSPGAAAAQERSARVAAED